MSQANTPHLTEHGYMKGQTDPVLKPCHKCGAEINANWTIRGLLKKVSEMETDNARNAYLDERDSE